MFIGEATVKLPADLTVQYVEPHMKFKSDPQVQERNDNGVPLWDVYCVYLEPGRRPEIVKVRAAFADDPVSFLKTGTTIPKGMTMPATPWVKGNRVAWTFKIDEAWYENYQRLMEKYAAKIAAAKQQVRK